MGSSSAPVPPPGLSPVVKAGGEEAASSPCQRPAARLGAKPPGHARALPPRHGPLLKKTDRLYVLLLKTSPLQKFCHLPPNRSKSPVVLPALGHRSPASPGVTPLPPKFEGYVLATSSLQIPDQGLDVASSPRGSVARGH